MFDIVVVAYFFVFVLVIMSIIFSLSYLKIKRSFLQSQEKLNQGYHNCVKNCTDQIVRNAVKLDQTCETLKKDFKQVQKSFDRRYLFLQNKYQKAIALKKKAYSELESQLAEITKSPLTYFDSGNEKLQNDVVSALCQGKHIFLTGGAGTGKTYFIGQVARKLAVKTLKEIHIAAYSGMAAVSLTDTTGLKPNHYILGLRTAHSVFKLPISNANDNQANIEDMRNSLQNCVAVIIDEISMMDKITFERLMKRIPENCGIMLVGDFFQLPPIPNVEQQANGVNAQFAFESDYFNDFMAIQLETVQRQSNPYFINFLNEMRIGIPNWDFLQKCSTIPIDKALKIYGTRAMVNNENMLHYNEIESPETICHAVIEPCCNPQHNQELYNHYWNEANKWFKQFKTFKGKLPLKVGLQVICLKNIGSGDNSLVNGDMGVIEEIGQPDHRGLPSYITFNTFRKGKIELHPYKFEYQEYSHNTQDYVTVCNIHQYPLGIGYALTIHKTQGMTVNAINIDGANANFACGQAYVALSRVRDISNMYICNQGDLRTLIDQRVLDFYRKATPFKVPDQIETVSTPSNQ